MRLWSVFLRLGQLLSSALCWRINRTGYWSWVVSSFQCLFFSGSESFHNVHGVLPGRKAMTNLESESEVAQSCPTLCDPVDCSPPGSSIHRILQARILEWVAISFSRGSSQSRDWTQVSHIASIHFNLWATIEPGSPTLQADALTSEPPGKPLYRVVKSRDIALPAKVYLVKAMVFPVLKYGHESGTIKKAEHRRIDVFELWCWRRLLRVPWTARRSI